VFGSTGNISNQCNESLGVEMFLPVAPSFVFACPVLVASET
jgi:hypothetical protein